MKQWIPHKYQQNAIRFMLERGAAGLFLDPGLGKTSITLAAIKILRDKGYIKRALIIAPLRVAQLVWPMEVVKWAEFNDLRVVVLHGKDKDALARKDADVYVVNPEGIWAKDHSWYFDYAHKYVKPDMLVIDESTKFKNSGSKRFKALRKNIASFQRRYILTGTPAPKGYEDLFAQVFILDQGAALGRYITQYRREHFNPGHGSGHVVYSWELKEGHDQIILDKIAPFILRMQAEDYLDLPQRVDNTVYVELGHNVLRHYQELEAQFVTAISEEHTVEALTQASLNIKLRQLCNGGIYTPDGEAVHVDMAKCQALQDLMEEAGKPILCLTEFRHDVDRLREFFGQDLPYLGSGVSSTSAKAYTDSFNRGEIPLLLAHPASAGHGLNLQEVSNHVAFFGLPWDLELYDQAVKRVLRQGNPNTHVFVHHIIARDSIEEGMMLALEAKDRTQRSLLTVLRNYYQEKQK